MLATAGYNVRYFSPLAEVPFCGHATIASGVLLGPGEWVFATRSGEVGVDVTRPHDGLGDGDADVGAATRWRSCR